MNIKDKLSNNPLTFANAFNTYFSFAVENLNKNVSGKNTVNNIIIMIQYLICDRILDNLL